MLQHSLLNLSHNFCNNPQSDQSPIEFFASPSGISSLNMPGKSAVGETSSNPSSLPFEVTVRFSTMKLIYIHPNKVSYKTVLVTLTLLLRLQKMVCWLPAAAAAAGASALASAFFAFAIVTSNSNC